MFRLYIKNCKRCPCDNIQSIYFYETHKLFRYDLKSLIYTYSAMNITNDYKFKLLYLSQEDFL